MNETVTGFAKRMGSELKDFGKSKAREVRDKVQNKTTRLVATAEEQAYQAALKVVANHHDLTVKEAETRLTTSPEVTKTRRGSRSVK